MHPTARRQQGRSLRLAQSAGAAPRRRQQGVQGAGEPVLHCAASPLCSPAPTACPPSHLCRCSYECHRLRQARRGGCKCVRDRPHRLARLTSACGRPAWHELGGAERTALSSTAGCRRRTQEGEHRDRVGRGVNGCVADGLAQRRGVGGVGCSGGEERACGHEGPIGCVRRRRCRRQRRRQRHSRAATPGSLATHLAPSAGAPGRLPGRAPGRTAS